MRNYKNPSGTQDIVVVTDAGQTPLRHIVQHSPTGMTWGYSGSGPHDTALSILADFYEHVRGLDAKQAEAKAAWLHHMFCFECIAGLQDGWTIYGDDIGAWIDKHPETIETVK